MRQFYNSVSKDDYFALRNGFIAVSEITTITNMKLPHWDFMHGGYAYWYSSINKNLIVKFIICDGS